jgi:hypothetical protein
MTFPATYVTGSSTPVTAAAMNVIAGADRAYVENFGALGNDVADDTGAFQSAVNAAVTSGDRCICLTPGRIYRISAVTLPAVPITIMGYGATIRTTAAGSYAFTQTTRNLVQMFGLSFIGVGNGFNFNMAASATQFYDINIAWCRFDLPANKIGLNITGAREGAVQYCYFNNCTGYYAHQSINVFVNGCQFRNCTVGINLDGSTTGNAFDAGTIISNCVALGCGFALDAMCWDYMSVDNCMFDFNDHPIRITNTTGCIVTHTYASSRDTGGTSFPIIEIASNPALPQNGFSQHAKVTGCTLVTHSTVGNTTGIQLTGDVSFTHIYDNTIHFWKTYGIRSTGIPTGLWIKDNRIIGVGGAIVGAVSVPNTSNFTRIEGNITPQSIIGTGAGIVVRDNFVG